MTRIRVPASTSNLGPGFDSHGLALGLYLTLEVELAEEPYGTFIFDGEGAGELQRASEENIIFTAMRFAAGREGFDLRPARIRVSNQIPLARGLGSSGAAIIAGLSAFEIVTGVELSEEKLLAYATEIEGHSDNVSAALLGSFVVSSVGDDGGVFASTIPWPPELKAVVVIPEFKVRTEQARAVVPDNISRQDAVFNIQRASLMVAAIAGRRFDLMSEAMRDRLHQPYRAPLVPGLQDVLALRNSNDLRGLHGLALSGSGPTVVAFATEAFEEIGGLIAGRFAEHGIKTTARVLEIEKQGRVVGQ